MQTTIQKWGNSLAVRLPKEVANKLAFKEGSKVEINESSEGMLIQQIRHRPTLKELIESIDPANVHGEVDWGEDVGKEILPPYVWKKQK